MVHRSIKQHGGKREGAGAFQNNLNAMKKPSVWLPPELDYLNSPEEILQFQKRVISDLYSGRIGSRAAGSINNALRTLLSYYLDSKKLKEYEQYVQQIKQLVEKQEKQKQDGQST